MSGKNGVMGQFFKVYGQFTDAELCELGVRMFEFSNGNPDDGFTTMEGAFFMKEDVLHFTFLLPSGQREVIVDEFSADGIGGHVTAYYSLVERRKKAA